MGKFKVDKSPITTGVTTDLGDWKPSFTEKTDGKDTLIIHIFGRGGTGKTTLAMTAPGTIGVLPLDSNTRLIVHKTAKELGKKFVLADDSGYTIHSLPKNLRTLYKFSNDENVLREIFGPLYQRCILTQEGLMSHPKVDTILTDGGTYYTTMINYRHHGRKEKIPMHARGPDNEDMRDFLNAPRAHGKHLVVTWYHKPIWVERPDPGGGDPKMVQVECMGTMDGGNVDRIEQSASLVIETMQAKGWDEVRFMKQHLPLGAKNSPERKELVSRIKPGTFIARIHKCTLNASLIGTPDGIFIDEEITIPKILERATWEEYDERQWLFTK